MDRTANVNLTEKEADIVIRLMETGWLNFPHENYELKERLEFSALAVSAAEKIFKAFKHKERE